MVSESSFPWERLRIGLLDSCHMALSYYDSSLFILSNYYVTSKVTFGIQFFRYEAYICLHNLGPHGISGLTLHACVGSLSHKWWLPYFSPSVLGLIFDYSQNSRPIFSLPPCDLSIGYSPRGYAITWKSNKPNLTLDHNNDLKDFINWDWHPIINLVDTHFATLFGSTWLSLLGLTLED